jgi:DNA-binding transcriptional MerR regulator
MDPKPWPARRWAETVTKGPDAFRTISEASDELGVPQHVLRFWETKFSFIRPMKRAGGRRFYRPQDLEVLRGVRGLLHDQGYTIKGVQRLHKEQGLRRMVSAAGGDADAVAALEAELAAETQVQQSLPLNGEAFDPQTALDDAPPVQPAVRKFDADARARLIAVLEEIEAAKAGLDALLVQAPPAVWTRDA